MGVFAGRARLAVALQLVACLPSDDLGTHSSEWGLDASSGGGRAGEAPNPSAPPDAGSDSSAGGSNGSPSPDPQRDAATDRAPLPDGGDFDASAAALGPDPSLDASTGVLAPAADGG